MRIEVVGDLAAVPDDSRQPPYWRVVLGALTKNSLMVKRAGRDGGGFVTIVKMITDNWRAWLHQLRVTGSQLRRYGKHNGKSFTKTSCDRGESAVSIGSAFWRVLVVLTILGLLVLSCGNGDSARRPENRSISMRDAAQYAGFELPPTAEAIGSYEMNGVNRLVAFAVRLSPADLATVLAGGHFTAELRPGRRVFQEPVRGVNTDAAGSFAAGQDRLRVQEREVTRDVLVITDDPGSTVLHVWAYTT